MTQMVCYALDDEAGENIVVTPDIRAQEICWQYLSRERCAQSSLLGIYFSVFFSRPEPHAEANVKVTQEITQADMTGSLAPPLPLSGNLDHPLLVA